MTIDKDEPSRHFLIFDTQVKPGVPTDHLDWIGQAIVDYNSKHRIDAVVHLGDHWDFPSLNSHVKPGSAPLEGARYLDDIESGNRAFVQIAAPMEKEQARRAKKANKLPPWKPRKEFIMGNHEDRADRAAVGDPKLLGTVGSNACDVRDWKWNGFLKRVFINDICYSHYFQNSHSKFAIGGEVSNRLNKIGCSFVQGHEQGFRYGNRICGSGKTMHGLVCGSSYLHVEDYRGAQGQQHWRGVVILNGVRNGSYNIMPLDLDYLCRKYEGMSLSRYMAKKYPKGDWEHLA